jgi:methionyl-tRNA synthetase
VLPTPAEYSDADVAIQATVAKAAADADKSINSLAIHDAISAIWTIVEELNGYITIQEPWVLAKNDETRERLGTVLYTASEGLRALAVLLSPVIPDATAKLWSALGAAGSLDDQLVREAGTWGQLAAGSTFTPLEPLFPRIEEVPE